MNWTADAERIVQGAKIRAQVANSKLVRLEDVLAELHFCYGPAGLLFDRYGWLHAEVLPKSFQARQVADPKKPWAPDAVQLTQEAECMAAASPDRAVEPRHLLAAFGQCMREWLWDTRQPECGQLWFLKRFGDKTQSLLDDISTFCDSKYSDFVFDDPAVVQEVESGLAEEIDEEFS